MNSRSSPELPESPLEPTGDLPGLSVLPGSIQACIVIATSYSLHAQELQQLLPWLEDQIVVIRTQAEFWELMKTCPLGLLIVDRSFGGQDETGEDWCRRLRESVGYQTLPILLLGERTDPHFIEAAFAAGATDYLTLPLQAAEVQNRVKTQLALLSLQSRMMDDLDRQRALQPNSYQKLLLALQSQLRAQSERLWAKNILLEHEVQERQNIENALREAHAQSDRLLRNILPDPIADRLKAGEECLADRYEEATILFADIVDFTPFSSQLSPLELMEILNQIFCIYSQIGEYP